MSKMRTMKIAVAIIIFIWTLMSFSSCSSRKLPPGRGNYIHEHSHRAWWWHQADSTKWLDPEIDEYIHCKDRRR